MIETGTTHLRYMLAKIILLSISGGMFLLIKNKIGEDG